MEVTKRFLGLLDEIEKPQDSNQYMTNDLQNHLQTIKNRLKNLDIDNLCSKQGSPAVSMTE